MIALVLFLYTLLTDGLESKVNNYGYYFSESALFGTVWLVMVPIVSFIYKLKLYRKSSYKVVFIILGSAILNIVIFAGIVWLCSLLLFNHTYHIPGTIQYAFLKYFLLLVSVYTIVILVFNYFGKSSPITIVKTGKSFSDILIVRDQSGKTMLKSTDILYIRASTPYVEIYTKGKKYLEQSSLKDMIEKLDPNIFVRVHKSSIINLHNLSQFTSRMNGDYDITMTDGMVIRMSRNFSTIFKSKMKTFTQLS